MPLFIIIWILFILILVLIAIRIGMSKKDIEEAFKDPTIHASGIYSIVRKSPRENIADFKPSKEEIGKYLAGKNEDIRSEPLTEQDKNGLVSAWNALLEETIAEVESGDRSGAEFYYFDYSGDDPVCEKFIDKGKFVTRREIYKYPQILPPFHLGCRCHLKKFEGKENLHDTSELGMRPLFSNQSLLPSLPKWTDILKM
jgi:hypothetical protein